MRRVNGRRVAALSIIDTQIGSESIAAPWSYVTRAIRENLALAKRSRGVTSAVNGFEVASPTRRLCDHTKNSTFTTRPP